MAEGNNQRSFKTFICFLYTIEEVAPRGRPHSNINTRLTFMCHFQGQAWLQVARVLSETGCLGLLTAGKRMLWLESDGVTSGEPSSQSWLIAAAATQPGVKMKWLLSVTLEVFTSNDYTLLEVDQTLQHEKKAAKNVACSCSFTCYSGHVISTEGCQTPSKGVTHESLLIFAERVISRRTPAKLVGDLTVWSCTRQLQWFSLPSVS